MVEKFFLSIRGWSLRKWNQLTESELPVSGMDTGGFG